VVLRGLFIFAGAAALKQSQKILLLFSAVLFASSYGILFASGEDEKEVRKEEKHALVIFLTLL